jgi:hypothetical protein
VLTVADYFINFCKEAGRDSAMCCEYFCYPHSVGRTDLK